MADPSDEAKPSGNPLVLSTAQKDEIKQWLAQKSAHVGGECPVCGENAWRIEDYLISGPLFSERPIALVTSVFPMVAMVCSNCAYVRQFMAMQLGLLKEEQPENEPDG